MAPARGARETDPARIVMAIGVAAGLVYAATYALQGAMSPVRGVAWLRTAAGLYAAATVVAFVLYGAVVVLAAAGRLRTVRSLTLALAFPVLFELALTAGRPSLSIDVLTYIGQGYQARVGWNPYAQPLRSLAGTQFGQELMRAGWLPVHMKSPYGPIFTEFESAVGRLSPDLATQTLVIKGVVTLFSLGCAVMIWLILGDVAPEAQALGTLVYLWNPVIVMEFAAEGHNDAIPIFFVLLSIRLWLRRRIAASVLALGAGALVKVVTVLVALPEWVFGWRRYRDRRPLVAYTAAGCAMVLVIAVVAYAPLWIGRATFDGLRAISVPTVLASTPGVIYWWLIRSHSPEASARLISFAATGGLLLYVAAASARIRTAAGFLEACGRISVVYVLLAPGYWPWYAALPIALLALAPSSPFLVSIFALSIGARLAAPIDALRLHGLMDWETEVIRTTVIGIWMPAAAIAALGVWRWWHVHREAFETASIWRRTGSRYQESR